MGRRPSCRSTTGQSSKANTWSRTSRSCRTTPLLCRDRERFSQSVACKIPVFELWIEPWTSFQETRSRFHCKGLAQPEADPVETRVHWLTELGVEGTA